MLQFNCCTIAIWKIYLLKISILHKRWLDCPQSIKYCQPCSICNPVCPRTFCALQQFISGRIQNMPSPCVICPSVQAIAFGLSRYERPLVCIVVWTVAFVRLWIFCLSTFGRSCVCALLHVYLWFSQQPVFIRVVAAGNGRIESFVDCPCV